MSRAAWSLRSWIKRWCDPEHGGAAPRRVLESLAARKCPGEDFAATFKAMLAERELVPVGAMKTRRYALKRPRRS